jgi:uncharacterized protein (TIGR02996 family)
MSDGESLYRSILAAPGDDAPRLVYADWLEEGGNLERAELTRHMVHFPRDRTGYRPPNPASIYWPDAPPWIGYGVRRGFVAEVGLSTRLFLAHAAELFAGHPITRVNLLDRHPIPRTGRSELRFAHITGERPEFPQHWPVELFPGVPEGTWRTFPSLGRALRDLSDAAVAFGREAAGLPPLESV